MQTRQSAGGNASFVLHQAPETVGEHTFVSHRMPVVMHEGRAVSQARRPEARMSRRVMHPPVGKTAERSAKSRVIGGGDGAWSAVARGLLPGTAAFEGEDTLAGQLLEDPAEGTAIRFVAERPASG